MSTLRTIFLLVLAGLWAVTFAVAQDADLTLSSVTLGSTSVAEGNSLQGTVTLNMAAPAGGAMVSLAADPANAATLPVSVTVPAGATSATFSVMARAASPVTIYGNYGVTKSAALSIAAPVAFDQIVDRIVESERAFVVRMKDMHPLAETYIQNLKQNREEIVVPVSDQYFLGRLEMNDGPGDRLFEKQSGLGQHVFNSFTSLFSRKFLPVGFAQMVMLDRDFQRKNYDFTFVRQEFLGEVRCVVIDVQPKAGVGAGRFTGRIWAEDHDFNIVRFNGTYSPNSRYSRYLHFDSWRMNFQSGLWLPAYIFSEESDSRLSTPPFTIMHFKAQTRLWGYDVEHLKHNEEFTQVQVEAARDQSATANDVSPLEAERLWERSAEDNATDHLQKIGLMAPKGDVDKVLETVVNNLIITNNLEIVPDVRCRVMLTTPLESFTIGHTIVISRGLLDVLPDEPSLAMVLAHELAHIALGHRIDTKLAFNDRFFFPDENTFQRLDFVRNPGDEEAADRKALELLASSPYKDKLGNAGLFLKALQDRAPELSNLIRPHLGNRLGTSKVVRMSALLNSAPQLETMRIDQIAALPLGSRIKMDPWSNQIQMLNAKRVALLSPQEKMPFEVTPFFPYLTRLSPVETDSIGSAGGGAK